MSKMKLAAGNVHYERHMKGEILSRKQAMLAKCADCMGFYKDGRVDCQVPKCPMYPYRPYKDAPGCPES